MRTADGRRLALRVHRPDFRTAAQTRLELRFLRSLERALSGSRVSVPRPVPTRDGDLVVETGRRHCSLLSWLDGEFLRPGRGLGPAAAHLLGEALARVHEAGLGFEAAAALPSWDAATLLRADTSPHRPVPLAELLLPEERAVFDRVVEEGTATFAALGRSGAERGLVHCDFIPGNCRFRRAAGGWRVGVLDFDDLGYGFFVYDLCVLLDHFLDEPGHGRLARAYLAGYRRVRPLPARLERHLPVLMAVRHATTCLWLAGRLRTGAEPVPVRRFLAIRTAAMRRCLALAR